MDCIKKCGKRASATPDLCLPCFRRICLEWFRFNNVLNGDDREGARFKNWMNRTQRRIRKIAKRTRA